MARHIHEADSHIWFLFKGGGTHFLPHPPNEKDGTEILAGGCLVIAELELSLAQLSQSLFLFHLVLLALMG